MHELIARAQELEEENQRLREGLEAIKSHMEKTQNEMTLNLSTIYYLTKQALKGGN